MPSKRNTGLILSIILHVGIVQREQTLNTVTTSGNDSLRGNSTNRKNPKHGYYRKRGSYYLWFGSRRGPIRDHTVVDNSKLYVGIGTRSTPGSSQIWYLNGFFCSQCPDSSQIWHLNGDVCEQDLPTDVVIFRRKDGIWRR